MGVLKNAIKKAIKRQVNKQFKPVTNSRCNVTRDVRLALREQREKQELAEKIKSNAKLQFQQHI